MKTFYLPDLGEGLPDGEINQWHVKEGSHIKEDELLVSIETAKAVVEVPSPFTGKVVKLHGKVGDIILTGAPLADFEVEGSKESSTVAGEIKAGNEILTERPLTVANRAFQVKILPSVRALAKKMNVDLTTVVPTGLDGTITADDVKKASLEPSQEKDWEPLRGVRRVMSHAMSQSHMEVAQVSIFDDADVSVWIKEKDLTVQVILAMIQACYQEPAINAWYNHKKQARRLIPQIHLGLAMDTEDGLFVPVIHDAQDKSAGELRDIIETLKRQVRDRSIDAKKLHGATLVLSNFGNFSGRYASPVVVPPTVAILGVGKLRQEPKVINDQIVIRSILPLSLSFDHRVLTGGEATRYLGTLMKCLS